MVMHKLLMLEVLILQQEASKNALHVAANDPNDLISTYSSFGPTLDGRLVPQISAVGSTVYSLAYNNGYQFMSGTSMATQVLLEHLFCFMKDIKYLWS
jgi:subtilisin family serine protease